MAVWKVVTAVTVLISLISTIILIAGVSLTKFVEVYIPRDANEPTADAPLAEVGVFKSVYDAGKIPEVAVANSGVPLGSFETATKDFPLLFPAQTNFVAEVIPVSRELLAQLDEAIGAPIPVASQLVLPTLEPILDLEFENCSNYIETQSENLQAFFAVVVNQLFPQAIKLQFAEPILELNTNVALAAAALGLPAPQNPVSGFILGFFSQAAAVNCGIVQTVDGSEVAVSLNDAQKGCVVTVFNTAGGAAQSAGQQATPAVLLTMAGFVDQVCQAGQSFLDCVSLINFAVVDTAFGAPIEFSAAAGSPTFCQVLPAEVSATLCASKGAYTQLIAGLGLENNNEALAGFGVFSLLFATGIIPPTATFAQTVVVFPNDFPSNFDAEPYLGCQMLQLQAQLDGVSIPGIPPLGQNCPFGNFFSSLVAVDPTNDLAPILGQVGGLFDLCNSTYAGFGIPIGPATCDVFFSFLFLNIAYGGELELSHVLTGEIEKTVEGAIKSCDDDETDLAKVGGAQVLIASAIVAWILTVAITILALVAKSGANYALSLASILSTAGCLLVTSSLLVIQSAPVFEGVGEPPAAFFPFYEVGVVSLLAVVVIALQALVGLTLFICSITVTIQISREAKEVKNEEVEEVAAPEPEVKEDVVEEKVESV